MSDIWLRTASRLPLALLLITLSAAAAPPATAPTTLPITAPSVDIVGPGDVLEIGVADLETSGTETVKTVRVDAAGNANLFFVGHVKLAGLSFSDAEKLIVQKYHDAGTPPHPQVSVNRLQAGGGGAPLKSGDMLRLHIIDHAPKVAAVVRFVRVSDGGAVGVPFVGQVTVAGLTEAQAEEAINKALHPNDTNPRNTVSVLRMPQPSGHP